MASGPDVMLAAGTGSIQHHTGTEIAHALWHGEYLTWDVAITGKSVVWSSDEAVGYFRGRGGTRRRM